MQQNSTISLGINSMFKGGFLRVHFDASSSKNAVSQILWNYDKQSSSEDFQSCSFTGKEKDEETGYGYFGARYMDHELMTMWLSVDPMADKYPSISPYAYCAWNPVKLVDPDGKDPIYGMIWFNLRKIGDDGQTNGKAYFVTGGKKNKCSILPYTWTNIFWLINAI